MDFQLKDHNRSYVKRILARDLMVFLIVEESVLRRAAKQRPGVHYRSGAEREKGCEEPHLDGTRLVVTRYMLQ